MLDRVLNFLSRNINSHTETIVRSKDSSSLANYSKDNLKIIVQTLTINKNLIRIYPDKPTRFINHKNNYQKQIL